MRRQLMSGLVYSSLLAVLVSCQTPEVEIEATPATPQAPTAVIEEEQPDPPADLTATPAPRSTATPPQAANEPTPTAPALPPGWSVAGSRQQGVQIGVPPTWIDLTGLRDEEAVRARFGDNLRLFAADSKATGTTLVAGSPLSGGAFALGFTRQAAAATAGESLAALLANVGIESAVVVTTTVGAVPAAYVDLREDPLNLLNGEEQAQRLRLILVPQPQSATELLILFGTPLSTPPAIAETFDRMLRTILVYAPQARAGAAAPGEVLDGLQSGVAIEASLSANSRHVYSFEARQGQFVTIIVDPLEAIDPVVSVIDPAGRTLAGSDSGYAGNAELLTDLAVPVSGTYFIQLSEFFNQGGSYRLTLFVDDEPRYTTGGEIAFGQEVRGELRANERHVWTFRGDAGQIISMILAPESEQLDIVLRLVGPDGSDLLEIDESFSGDAEILAGYRLEVSATYAVIIKDFTGRGGPYRLTLEEGEPDVTNFYEAGDLQSGAVRQELLQANEIHTWFFDGFAGDEINVIATPLNSNLDLDVWLLDPQLNRLLMRDDTLTGEIETIRYTLPADGQFILLVQDYIGEPGAYQISFTVADNKILTVGGEIYFAEAVMATLPEGQGTVWTLDAAEGERISATLTPETPSSDLILVLKSPTGDVVLTIDDGGPGEAESLEAFMLTDAGAWRLIVREFLSARATYELLVTAIR